MKLSLVKITDTSGKVTGRVGGVTYQALTDKELDNLLGMESDYSYISRDFQVSTIGDVEVPSLDED